MKIVILLFASLKERVGFSRKEFDLPDGSTVRDFKQLLSQTFPHLGGALDHALIAINQQFAFDEDVIPENAEVALFPPVSGGTELPTVVKVTTEVLDLDDLLAQITLPTTGAACFFTGMVRAKTQRDEPHETVRLEYEAYVPMAETKMAQVAEEIRQRWPSVEGIAIVQRIGLLEAGTPTVLIACTAAHRDTGVFEAARYGIDRLKEIVPIWKKEIGPNGEVWVEGKYHPKRGD